MRKNVLIVLLFVVAPSSFGAQYGLGTSATEAGDTLYFPIRTDNYIFEPFFSYYDEKDGSYSFESDSLGMGIFRLAPVADKISLYFGGRLALIEYQDSDPDFGDYKSDGTLIAPVLGAQYSISSNFTIALEHRIEYISEDVDQPTSTTVLHYDNNSTDTETDIVARIFF